MRSKKKLCSKDNQHLFNTRYFSSTKTIFVDDWQEILNKENLYLSLSYLKALEISLPSYGFRYVLFYDKDEKVIGLAYFQIIQITDKDIKFEALSNKMHGILPNSFKKWLTTRLLICGNAFATGENGFLFSNEVSRDDKVHLIDEAIRCIINEEEIKNRKVSISLIKEFWHSNNLIPSKFINYGYHELNIDVNMIAQIDSNWMVFNDYLNALNSKFRTKVKQVFKKSGSLKIIDFDVNTINERLLEIEELYNHMVDKSSFSFGRLNANTLLKLKESLEKTFYFKGYFLNNKLIGFATATIIDQQLDGNFIGIHHQYNKDYSVYQRILYDFISYAIDQRLKTVRLGRTAEEIKSGVGAMPNEMKFYAKHHNRFKNSILRPFLSLLSPSEFNLRRPFKSRNMIKKGA